MRRVTLILVVSGLALTVVVGKCAWDHRKFGGSESVKSGDTDNEDNDAWLDQESPDDDTPGGDVEKSPNGGVPGGPVTDEEPGPGPESTSGDEDL